ncbi:MAG: serine hydrolase [Kibdelosporangium sp.]
MAIVLGIAGCSTHAARVPAPELPLLTATAGATQLPSEWGPPPIEASSPPVSPSVRPALKESVELAVRRVSKAAVAATVVIDRDNDNAIVSENADRQFAAGSLVKLLIGMDALTRHPGDEKVRRRVSTMIQYSDDPTANSFWVSEGGTEIISRMSVRMGLQATEPPTPATRWGSTLVTANDMARIYGYIMTKADETHRDTIIKAMASAPSAGSDGFKQHFGIPAATKSSWAIKQAWATDLADRKLTHSTGLVGENWRYVVIVLTEHPAKQGWDTATKSVTAGAALAMSTLD